MDDLKFPNTDSPEVMAHAVTLQLVGQIWDQAYRTVDPDEMEKTLLELYQRIFKAISTGKPSA